MAEPTDIETEAQRLYQSRALASPASRVWVDWASLPEEEQEAYRRTARALVAGNITRLPCPTCRGSSRETVGMICPTCGTDYGPPTAQPESEDIKTAVGCRPHYPPCDHPDNPCSCGAFEDRTRIARALAAQREAVLEHMGARMAEAEELAVFDFLNWLAPQHVTTMRQTDTTAFVHAPEGQLWERWKAERRG